MLNTITKTYHQIQFLCLIFGLTLFVGACTATPEPEATPTPPPPTPAEAVSSGLDTGSDTLRLILWQAPTTLNLHFSTSFRDFEASRLTYEPLASFDKDGHLILFLAAEIPTQENGGLSPDGKSVTWKLKEGVKWSDGEPFTADDVKFTYEFITNPDVESDSAGNYADIESVEVIDDLTVKVNFKDVTPAWVRPFVGIRGVILPRHVFAEYNGPNASQSPANLKPVGTGPYRVVEFSTEEILIIGSDVVETVKIVYEANPFFREEGKPFFKRVELRGGGDAEVAARAVLEEGVVDYAANVQVDATVLSQLEALGKGKVVNNPGPYVERIFLNHTDPNRATAEAEFSSLQFKHPFLSDVRVRRAFAYAIDRQTIAELYGVTGRLTSSIMAAYPDYQTPEARVPDEFDLEKAKALLDEAGWIDTDGDGIRDKDGVKMKVLFQTTVNPLREQVQEIVKTALESIGVEVELKIIDVTIFGKPDPANVNNLYHFYADMQLLSWGSSTRDAGYYLGFWTCDQIPQLANNWSGENIERWCNSEYDELYLKSTTEVDAEKRRQLLIQMNTMLAKEVVTIPLIQRSLSSAVNNDIEGVDLTPWDSDVWSIKDWRRKSP